MKTMIKPKYGWSWELLRKIEVFCLVYSLEVYLIHVIIREGAINLKLNCGSIIVYLGIVIITVALSIPVHTVSMMLTKKLKNLNHELYLPWAYYCMYLE